MNKILCFDTSNNSCSVAISEGQNILFFQQELRPSMQAERLMVMVEQALSDTKLQYDDLDYLAVTIGPGSFTGIRIALAAAKGIIFASNLSAIAIDNFEAAYYRLHMQVKKYDQAIILLNAYRGQLYVQKFDNKGVKLEPKLMDIADVITMLKKDDQDIIACAGNGISAIYQEIKAIKNLIILPRFPTVKALHLARFADDKINAGIVENQQIEPLYIRPPDAIIPSS